MSLASDFSPDPAIRALLDQHAEIEAKLAALLPARYGPDIRLELQMLRQKLAALRALAVQHPQISDRIPVLSDFEEARALQYQCECIETACFEHGLDINFPGVHETLRLSLPETAPGGYEAWLDRNLSQHDPIARAWRLRGYVPPAYRRPRTFKCWDDKCLHYIYGFANEQERDRHAREHSSRLNRDSAWSISQTPPFVFSDQSKHSPPFYLPRPSGSTRLATPPAPGLSRHHQDSLRAYSLQSAHAPPTRDLRGSVDSDVDPLLPPLKRSRVGQSRLESIEELRLPTHLGQCLRCRILQKTCDSISACSSCSNPSPVENGFWAALGCHRGPLVAFADIFLPLSLSPRSDQALFASPMVQRKNINDYLDQVYSANLQISGMVQSHLDFDDGFWWTQDLLRLPPSTLSMSSFSRQPMDRAPPLLSVLGASWNMGGTAYDFWQLLKLSGRISPNRDVESATHPILYQSKLLLREVLFYDLQQPEPSIYTEPRASHPPPLLDESLSHERYRCLHSCMTEFLRLLESTALHGPVIEPRTWLAMFVSLCIFSIVTTILVDLAPSSPRTSPLAESSPESATGLMTSAFKALVSIFAAASPISLDDLRVDWSEGDRSLFSSLAVTTRKESWANVGIISTKDFLMLLGTGKIDEPITNGFIRHRPASGRLKALAFPSTATAGEEHRRHLSDSRAIGDPWAPNASFPGRESLAPRFSMDHSMLSPQAVSPGSRRHTVAEAPVFRRGGRGLSSPVQATGMRTPYTRPVRRVYCTKCNEYPEGFRGDHELRRHHDAKHAALVKRWVCCEPQSYDPGSPRPVVSLSKCKACVAQKRYGAYYNAAAHLRRGHFNPNKGGKASGDWPPMTILKDWMREVTQSVDANDQESDSGDDDADYKEHSDMIMSQSGCRSPILEAPTLAPAPPPLTPDIHPHALATQPHPPLLAASPFDHHSVATPTVMNFQTSPWPNTATSYTNIASSTRSDKSPVSNRNRCPHPQCGRVFKDLAAHMLTHMEERPEKCPIETCEYHTKGFARKYDKNRHALTHYKGTMVCPFCPGPGTAYEKAFNRADVFKRHLTAVHNVEPTPPNSRKQAGTGNSSTASGREDGSASNGGARAKCSICQSQFTAQEFYEHLDDCVLNVIVPSATPRSATSEPSLTAPATGAGGPSTATSSSSTSIGRETGLLPTPISAGPDKLAVDPFSEGKSRYGLQGFGARTTMNEAADRPTTPPRAQEDPKRTPRGSSVPQASFASFASLSSHPHPAVGSASQGSSPKLSNLSEGYEKGRPRGPPFDTYQAGDTVEVKLGSPFSLGKGDKKF